MTHPRLSTVFDYADLRLHPDGTRVYQKPSNFRPGIIKVAVQNSRASWIARDAGGSGKIHKMRPRGKMEEQGASQGSEGEDPAVLVAEVEAEIEDDVEVDEESDEQGKSSKETKKRKGKPADKRKAKRQKFAIDYDYLLPKSSGPHEVETPMVDDSVNDEAIFLPEPSPDLLKCIHRFAAEFYTERGQLLNISREYRKQRKKRAQKRARQRLRASRKEEGLDSLSDLSSSESSKSKEDSEEDPASNAETEQESDDDREEADLDSDDHGEGPSTSQKMKGNKKIKRKGRRRAGKLYTDMYKMFDGSAIMALGMLVQEHIAHLLMPQVPPGWDDEMRNFFNSQRSEEGPLQTGLITTETNEELDLVDEAAPSHEDDGDEDDSEEEETVDEQTPPSHGDFSEREREQDFTVSDDQASKWSHSTPGKLRSERGSAHVEAALQLNADSNHLETSFDESFYLRSPEVDSEED